VRPKQAWQMHKKRKPQVYTLDVNWCINPANKIQHHRKYYSLLLRGLPFQIERWLIYKISPYNPPY
jgi:hypothetical protein